MGERTKIQGTSCRIITLPVVAVCDLSPLGHRGMLIIADMQCRSASRVGRAGLCKIADASEMHIARLALGGGVVDAAGSGRS